MIPARWLSVLAVAALASGAPSSARADEPAGVHEADAIVVEDERPAAQVFDDVPEERQVITREEIARTPATNVADVVSRATGLRTQQRVQGEEAAVSIEGMPPEYTRILVNGRRYTGELGAVDDLRDVPLTNVERIELLRGSQALRYGGEAAGGVVNVITRRPPEEGARLDLEGGFGSDRKALGAGTAAFRLGPAGVTLSATHDQIDGFEPDPDADAVISSAGGRDSRRISNDVLLDAEAPLGESVTWTGGMGWLREDDDVVPADSSDGEGGTRLFTRWLAHSGAAWQVLPSTRVSLDTSWYRGDTDSDVGRAFRQEEREWRAELFADHAFETGPLAHLTTLGLDAQLPSLDLDESATSADFGVGAGRALDEGPVAESFGLLGLVAQHEIELDRWATLSAGVREQLHDEFGPALLPQAALLVRPLSWLRLRGSWGRNRRTPSLPDLYQPAVPQLGGAYFLAGNPDLEAESSRSWRVGAELEPASWVALSATWFDNRIRDMIRSQLAGEVVTGQTTLPAQFPPGSPVCGFFPELCTPVTQLQTAALFRKQNLDRVRTKGVESQLVLRPHRRIEATAAYAFLDTAVDAENLPDLEELPNSPHHTVDLALSVRAPVTETLFSGRARWRSSALVETSGTGLLGFTASERSTPSWVVDFRISQPVGERFEVYADLANAFDRKVVDSYQIRGRTLFVGLRMNFGLAGAPPALGRQP